MKVQFELSIGNSGDHGEHDMKVTAHADLERDISGLITFDIAGKLYEFIPGELVEMLAALGHIRRSRTGEV